MGRGACVAGKSPGNAMPESTANAYPGTEVHGRKIPRLRTLTDSARCLMTPSRARFETRHSRIGLVQKRAAGSHVLSGDVLASL